MKQRTKVYLGDSVYADIENGMIKLTTEDCVDESNTIYLEPEVYNALVQYVQQRPSTVCTTSQYSSTGIRGRRCLRP